MDTDKYPIKKSIILDIMAAAISIQDRFGEFLKAPAKGAYIRGQLEPVVDPFQPLFLYHHEDAGKFSATIKERHRYLNKDVAVHDVEFEARPVVRGLPIGFGEMMKRKVGVMDESGKILVPNQLGHLLMTEPTVPATALRLVKELLDGFLAEMLAWTPKRSPNDPHRPYEIIERHFAPNVIWQDTVDANNFAAASKQIGIYNKQDVMEDILSQLRHQRALISGFVDGHEWDIHFCRSDNTGRSILVAQSIDYRVMIYNEKTASGEW